MVQLLQANTSFCVPGAAEPKNRYAVGQLLTERRGAFLYPQMLFACTTAHAVGLTLAVSKKAVKRACACWGCGVKSPTLFYCSNFNLIWVLGLPLTSFCGSGTHFHCLQKCVCIYKHTACEFVSCISFARWQKRKCERKWNGGGSGAPNTLCMGPTPHPTRTPFLHVKIMTYFA